MIGGVDAERFAREWAEAWNRADIEAVLSGWAEDAEFTSPRLGGTVRGKPAVRAWWQEALTPGLAIRVLHVLSGHSSVVVVYVDHLDRVRCEVFSFDAAGRVTAAVAHGPV